jgi:hypothetical protein
LTYLNLMEELIELRQYIEAHDYDKALELVTDLEEMSKDDKLNQIYSYGIVLLVHLIKQQAEKRSTRSWEFSIYNAIEGIQRVNRRRKEGATTPMNLSWPNCWLMVLSWLFARRAGGF